MHRRQNLQGKVRLQNLPAIARDPKGRSEKRLGRSRAKANDQLRPNESQFGFQSGPAGRDFALINARRAFLFSLNEAG
jgi:hypothetical protein